MKLDNTNLQAITYALASFTIWVVTDALIKLAAGNAAVPINEIMGFFGLFGVIGIVAKSGWQTGFISLRPREWHTQWPRILFVIGISLSNALALKHLTLVMFYIIVFTGPLFVAVVGALTLGERLTVRQALASLIGFAGVIVALNPTNLTAGNDYIGVIAGIASMIFFSVNTLWLRVATQTETADSMLFIVYVAEIIVGFGVLPWSAAPLNGKALLILAGMGLTCFVGDLWNLIALKYATAATVEQYHYTQIVTGALLGFLIWGEALTWPIVIGAILIITAGLYVALQENGRDRVEVAE